MDEESRVEVCKIDDVGHRGLCWKIFDCQQLRSFLIAQVFIGIKNTLAT